MHLKNMTADVDTICGTEAKNHLTIGLQCKTAMLEKRA
jgi:hypothetical protein